MVHLLSSLSLASLLATVPATPDSARSDTATYTLPEIVVTALRGEDRLRNIPAAAFVFDRERIRKSGVSRISSLLEMLPGLYGYLRNSSGDPTVVDPRGFTANGESSYLKILVDGQDVRDVENGNVDWDWIMPDDVERLEVVEGPGAWAWGDAAEGGIVNIVRPVEAPGFHSDCAGRVGSFGLAAGSIVLSGRSDPWSGSMRQSLRDVDGWRHHAHERVYAPGAELRLDPNETTRLSLQAAWLDADREDPGTLTPDQIAADRTQSETTTDFAHSKRLLLSARLGLGHARSSEWSITPYLRTERVDQVRTIFFQTKSHPLEAWTGGGELSWRGSARLGDRVLELSAGTQFEQSRLDSRYFDYDTGTRGDLRSKDRSHRTVFAGFASARVPLREGTVARFGFREDAVRVSADHVLEGSSVPTRTPTAASPFIALSQDLGARGSMYASYGAAFRVPTLNQLFDRRPFDVPIPGGGFATIYLSNQDLEPQRARSAEIGARCDGADGSSGSITLYSIWVRDEIDFDGVHYANIGKSLHRGIQAGVSRPIVSSLGLRVGGTWSPTTIVGGLDDGHQINAVPLGSGYASVSWSPFRFASIEPAVRYVARQYLDKANEHRVPDFTVVDLTLGLRVRKVHGTLRVANLLDRKYADTGFFLDPTAEERLSPAPGRGFTLSLSAD
jgi:outer membrane receptor protein involved in Fe transport